MRVLVLIAALVTVLLGFVIGCIGLAAILLSGDADPLSAATFGASVIALTLGLGLALAWHAWRAAQGHPSAGFRPGKVGLWLLLYVLILAAGQMAISLDLLPAVTFPPFHIAAAVLPAFVILALVARGLAGTSTWRDLSLQVASGAIVSTSIAFLLEVLVILGFLGIALLGLVMRPGGLELLQRLSATLEAPSWAQEPDMLVPALASPLLVVVAYSLFAVIVPVVEEAVKTVGVGLRAYRQPTMAQCYLWGLACGAGFAIVEALLNTLGGLDSWAPMAVLRAAATLLHCTTGAIMGIAWYRALARRGWVSVLGLYATSVAIHGLWNAASASMTLISIRSMSAETANASQLLTSAGVLAVLATLFALALGTVLTLAWLTSYVRRASHAEIAEQAVLAGPTSPGSVSSRAAEDLG